MTNVYNFIKIIYKINNYEKIISIKVGLSYKVLGIVILIDTTKLKVTLALAHIYNSLFNIITTSFSKCKIINSFFK
jgi:hypothetical protein